MKIFRLILVLVLFLSTNSVLAEDFQYLYSVKNTKAENVQKIVEFYLRQNNVFYIDSQKEFINFEPSKNSRGMYAMSFTQKNEDTYFYFYTSENHKDIIKGILKRFKINNLKYSQIKNNEIFNQEYRNLFSKMNNTNQNTNKSEEKYDFKENTQTQYDFSEDAQKKYDSLPYTGSNINSIYQVQTEGNKNIFDFANKNQPVISPNNTHQGQVTTQNTNPFETVNLTIPVILQSAISSSSLDEQDRISALLQEDLYINNKIKAKKGSIFYGTATKAQRAGRAYTNGSITLLFDKILTTEGNEINIKSEPVNFENQEAKKGAKIAGAMTGGILLGLAGSAIGAMFSSGNAEWGRRLSTGAILGAVGGGVVVLSSNGEDIDLKEGLVLQIKITAIQ